MGNAKGRFRQKKRKRIFNGRFVKKVVEPTVDPNVQPNNLNQVNDSSQGQSTVSSRRTTTTSIPFQVGPFANVQSSIENQQIWPANSRSQSIANTSRAGDQAADNPNKSTDDELTESEDDEEKDSSYRPYSSLIDERERSLVGGKMIVDFNCFLKPLIELIKCPECGSKVKLCRNVETAVLLHAEYSVKCKKKSCAFVLKTITNTPVDREGFGQANLLLYKAIDRLGLEEQDAQKFCDLMCLDTPKLANKEAYATRSNTPNVKESRKRKRKQVLSYLD